MGQQWPALGKGHTGSSRPKGTMCGISSFEEVAIRLTIDPIALPGLWVGDHRQGNNCTTGKFSLGCDGSMPHQTLSNWIQQKVAISRGSDFEGQQNSITEIPWTGETDSWRSQRKSLCTRTLYAGEELTDQRRLEQWTGSNWEEYMQTLYCHRFI